MMTAATAPNQRHSGASLAATVAGTVLRLRAAPNIRPDLRRGHTSVTDRFAVPHLARLWADGRDWARTPVLRFAALAASHPDLANSSKGSGEDGATVWPTRLGRFLALTAIGLGATDRIGQRVVMIQTGDVEKLHVVLRNAVPRRLPSGGPTAVSWFDVADLYLHWDYPDRTIRRAVRQRLLDDFFQTSPTGAA